ncbi:MAG: ABC transporter substrate-binding protein [Rhodospirillales bacterium]|nr:ABC transporter substrate-binding protein [Rhodospirillales bacterium]
MRGSRKTDSPVIPGPKSAGRRAFLKGSAVAGAGIAAASTGLLAKVNEGRAADGEPIPIGQGAMLSGWAAPDGIEFDRGQKMAIEEINAWGGILGRPLEQRVVDTKEGGPDLVIQAFRRLIDRDNVHAIMCGYNLATLEAEYDPIADAGIVYLHCNTSLAHHGWIQRDADRYFGCFMSDPSEYWYGGGYVQFLSALRDSGKWTPHNNKIAIVNGAQNYSIVIGNSVKENAPAYGFEINYEETVNIPISEWGPTLAKIRNDPPGAICITHYAPADLANFMLQFIPSPTPSLVYMQYGPSLAQFREIGKEAVEGVLYATVIAHLHDEIGQDFVRRYTEKWGAGSSPASGVQTYDQTHLWAISAAIAGGPGEPYDGEEQNRKVADWMRRLSYRGICGSYRFTENAGTHYPAQTNDPSLGLPHQFLQVQDYTQAPVLIAPEPYGVADFVLPPWLG